MDLDLRGAAFFAFFFGGPEPDEAGGDAAAPKRDDGPALALPSLPKLPSLPAPSLPSFPVPSSSSAPFMVSPSDSKVLNGCSSLFVVDDVVVAGSLLLLPALVLDHLKKERIFCFRIEISKNQDNVKNTCTDLVVF